MSKGKEIEKYRKNRKYFTLPEVWDICFCLGTKVRTHVSNYKCLYEELLLIQ